MVRICKSRSIISRKELTQSVAFHCHQAVEKTFKALIENIGLRVPKIHDLERLYGLIKEQGIDIEINEDTLDQINDVYIDSRYPSNIGLLPEGKPSVNKVKEFYSAAKLINEKINQIIKSK